MNVLQKIFNDSFDEIRYTLHLRKCELESIEKMIHYSDLSLGGTMYGCPHCGNLKFVPFRCHSRFCPTCSNKYAMERTPQISFKLVDVQHRHCVFTIDENLRHFFLETAGFLTVSSMPLTVLSYTRSTNLTNLSTILQIFF